MFYGKKSTWSTCTLLVLSSVCRVLGKIAENEIREHQLLERAGTSYNKLLLFKDAPVITGDISKKLSKPCFEVVLPFKVMGLKMQGETQPSCQGLSVSDVHLYYESTYM